MAANHSLVGHKESRRKQFQLSELMWEFVLATIIYHIWIQTCFTENNVVVKSKEVILQMIRLDVKSWVKFGKGVKYLPLNRL